MNIVCHQFQHKVTPELQSSGLLEVFTNSSFSKMIFLFSIREAGTLMGLNWNGGNEINVINCNNIVLFYAHFISPFIEM